MREKKDLIWKIFQKDKRDIKEVKNLNLDKEELEEIKKLEQLQKLLNAHHPYDDLDGGPLQRSSEPS